VRRTIIAGNWKLNPPRERGARLEEAIERGLAERAAAYDGVLPAGVEVWLLPPAPYLGLFAVARSLPTPRARFGAQDLSTCEPGAHTGEIGAALLREFGCGLALAGHSERRQGGETDLRVAAKAVAAAAAGLIPLLCVGETEAERDAGETIAVVTRQLGAVTARLPEDRPLWLAYEPVWAIGTGKNATPEQAVEVHRALRALLDRAGRDGGSTPILYGGSVKPENAASLLAEDEIDGALVGGASLEAESFLAIVDAAIARRRSGATARRAEPAGGP